MWSYGLKAKNGTLGLSDFRKFSDYVKKFLRIEFGSDWGFIVAASNFKQRTLRGKQFTGTFYFCLKGINLYWDLFVEINAL